jgi:hypothetical protein
MQEKFEKQKELRFFFKISNHMKMKKLCNIYTTLLKINLRGKESAVVTRLFL